MTAKPRDQYQMQERKKGATEIGEQKRTGNFSGANAFVAYPALPLKSSGSDGAHAIFAFIL
ncbi:hypothetical protein [Roseibium litorale]|uniref:Uncharacterized protein n=1 Tax=Roseibium litorale TaxID=2803841 RepID=A0ABR9CTK3_9HYPH|nr:hypothetical protein [Roseibium litorale]MBD8893919.1 hypothetical protein [Roseibium litorale]